MMKFKHYLEFVSLGMTELYEINEPIGFTPSAKFVREQEPQRYARSYEYFAIDKLKFIDAYSNVNINERVVDSIGTTSEYMDYGLNFILDSLKKKGQHAKINYHCSLNGVFFPKHKLELKEKDLTDGKTFLECKLVQSDKVAEIKTKLDDKVNIFATEDYKGNPINPAPTINILRKGLIESKSSEINLQKEHRISTFSKLGGGAESGTATVLSYFNPAINIVKSELKHTVNHIDTYEDGPYEDVYPNSTSGDNPTTDVEDLYYYYSQKETFNLKVEIKNLNWVKRCLRADNGYVDFKFFITAGYSAAGNEFYYNNFIYETLDNAGQETTTNINQTFTIPYIPVGGKVYIYFYHKVRKSNEGLGGVSCWSIISPYQIKFNADVKALDLVFPAVRYIDFLKQSLMPINQHPVTAPLFDVGGAEYNKVVWGKRNVTGKVDALFTTPKKALETTQIRNCDHELNNNFCFIGTDDDYYVNQEIAVFNVVPDEAVTWDFNPKASVKKLAFKFPYASDRDIKNTDKVVHGESEWSSNVEGAIADFERSFELIYDPLLQQDIIDLETKKPTTITDVDDKICASTITELAPSTKADFTFRLLLQANGNIRKVKNYSLAGGEEQDLGLNWLSMGLSVGQEVQVNNELWTVTAIEQDTTDSNGQIVGGGKEITFTASTSATFQGDETLRFQYSYTGVKYVTKTQQGFSDVEGVSETFGNLDYTPKRNMEYFKKLLAISAIKNNDLKISNVQYKNNGNLKTKKTTETEFIIENAPIIKADLPAPYITDLIYNIKLAVPFEQAVAYFAGYYQNRGFIRCLLPNNEVLKGFPKKIEYSLVTREMIISELEELYEGVYLKIDTVGDDLFVNDVKYSKSGNLNWFEFRNDKLKVYDEKSRAISNWYDYNLVILNGVTYDSKDALYLALKNG